MDRALRLLGAAAGVDALACITERSGLVGPGGRASLNGTCRLLPTAEGWMALSLARPDDVELLPAWLEADVGPDPWGAVASAVQSRCGADVVARGRSLGLPVAVLGEREPGPLYVPQQLGDAPALSRP